MMVKVIWERIRGPISNDVTLAFPTSNIVISDMGEHELIMEGM